MTQRKRKLLCLAFLTMLLLTSALIDFFHTEAGADQDPYCPACRFRASSLATVVILFVVLPSLARGEIIASQDRCEDEAQFVKVASARSPPF
jgi:hypothetical protein